jgi:hypothetical protein
MGVQRQRRIIMYPPKVPDHGPQIPAADPSDVSEILINKWPYLPKLKRDFDYI